MPNLIYKSILFLLRAKEPHFFVILYLTTYYNHIYWPKLECNQMELHIRFADGIAQVKYSCGSYMGWHTHLPANLGTRQNPQQHLCALIKIEYKLFISPPIVNCNFVWPLCSISGILFLFFLIKTSIF